MPKRVSGTTTISSKEKQEKIENNSVETTTSSGVADLSDAKFIELYGQGLLPSNKENRKRAEKLENS